MFTRAKKSRARGDATRSAIIRAATELFAKSGYKGTPIRAILEKAGTSMGSFYHHFENKADLYISIVDEGSLAVRRFMRNVGDFESGASLEERVWAFFRAYIRAASKTDSMVLLLTSEKETLPANIKNMVEDEIARHRRELEQGLAAGVTAGFLKPIDVRHGVAEIRSEFPENPDISLTVDSLVWKEVVAGFRNPAVALVKDVDKEGGTIKIVKFLNLFK